MPSRAGIISPAQHVSSGITTAHASGGIAEGTGNPPQYNCCEFNSLCVISSPTQGAIYCLIFNYIRCSTHVSSSTVPHSSGSWQKFSSTTGVTESRPIIEMEIRADRAPPSGILIDAVIFTGHLDAKLTVH